VILTETARVPSVVTEEIAVTAEIEEGPHLEDIEGMGTVPALTVEDAATPAVATAIAAEAVQLLQDDDEDTPVGAPIDAGVALRSVVVGRVALVGRDGADTAGAPVGREGGDADTVRRQSVREKVTKTKRSEMRNHHPLLIIHMPLLHQLLRRHLLLQLRPTRPPLLLNSNNSWP
jgi:hypothetical protein